MNINNAILHVFDFVSCVNVFAQAPMDLGNKAAKRYVTSQAKRALGNLDSKRGTFAENSLFAEELRAYFRGERDFVGLSQQIGEFIVGELSRMEKTPSTDLLVVDFEGDAAADHHGGELVAAGGADVDFLLIVLVGDGVEHGQHIDVLSVSEDEAAESVRVQTLPALVDADTFIGVQVTHGFSVCDGAGALA